MQQVFITSTYRSGVLLITKSLSVSHQININVGIVNYFRSYFNNKSYSPIKRKYKKIIHDCYQRLKKRNKIIIDKKNCLKYLKKNGVSHKSLIEIFNLEISKISNVKIIGDAETNAWRSIPSFLKIFPNSKVIIILRDPRDILCSFKRITIGKKNDYLISIFNNLDLIKKTIKFKKKYKNKIIIMKFHDFKTNRKAALMKFCKYLKVKFEKKMLDERSFVNFREKQWKSSYSFKGRLKKKTMGRWKKIIKPEDLYLCEHILKEQIRYMGLKPSNWIFTKKNIEDAQKKIHSSSLLKQLYRNWKKIREGSDKFPLNPLNPKTWGDIKR